MSDLLALAGWIGEHPVDGSDVANLLVFPATDLDPQSAPKISLIAQLWGMAPALEARGLPFLDVTVDLRAEVVRAAGEAYPMPAVPPAWVAAAIRHGFVVLSLTTSPLSAPSMDDIEQLLDHHLDTLWSGRGAVVGT